MGTKEEKQKQELEDLTLKVSEKLKVLGLSYRELTVRPDRVVVEVDTLDQAYEWRAVLSKYWTLCDVFKRRSILMQLRLRSQTYYTVGQFV